MIFRVSNPAAARSPQILEATKRALAACSFTRAPLDVAARHLLGCCADPCLGLWLGMDGDAICAVVACSLPGNPLAQNPEVFVAANWGPPALHHEMAAAAIAFAKDAGYNKLVAWNRSGRSDAAFVRKFRSFGAGRKLGSMIEFTETAG